MNSETEKEQSGDTRKHVMDCMQLAYCCVLQNNPSQALQYFTNAYALAQSSEYDLAIRSLVGKGVVQILQGDAETAIGELGKCPSLSDLYAAIKVEIKGPLSGHLAFGDLLFRIAEDHAKRNEFQQATNFYGYAQEAYSKVAGPGSAQVARCIERQSAMDTDPGALKTTEEYLQTLLDCAVKAGGPFTPDALAAHLELARHLLAASKVTLYSNNYDAACDWLTRAFDELEYANSIIPPATHSTQFYVSPVNAFGSDAIDPSVKEHEGLRILSDGEYSDMVDVTFNLVTKVTGARRLLLLSKAERAFISQRGEGTSEVLNLRQCMNQPLRRKPDPA